MFLLFLSEVINGLKCIGTNTRQNTCTYSQRMYWPQSVKSGVARYITSLKL